jgi:hypothetical protein
MARRFGRRAVQISLILLFAAAVGLAAKAASITMPYRLSYWEGLRFHRWLWIWYGAVVGALACVPVWMCLASTRREKMGGLLAGPAVVLFFFMAHPSFVHSITSAKNHCINQLREVDGAKERWAELIRRKNGDEVDLTGVVELLRLKKLPECPEGGPYRIGKVGEVPRCAIAEHNLE